MRWVKDEAEFEKIFIEAQMCVYVDSRRASTPLQLLVFDDPMLCTDYFLPALKHFMEWSADPAAYFVVLRPDPIDNFCRLYGKYPVLEIARDDSPEAYLGALNEDLGDGRGFSLSNLCLTWVIVTLSKRWFIHAIRSAYDDSGHLWIPPEWTARLLAAHPGVFFRPATPGEGRERPSGSRGSAVP